MMNDKGSMPEADEIDAQLKLIAKMLREARAPLIYGLTQLTVEAQELAVELAMCLRGAIDTPRGSRIPPRGTSLQLYGEARATSGELRQYADLLVFVGLGGHYRAFRFLIDHELANRDGYQVFHVQLQLTHPAKAKPSGIGVCFKLPEFAQQVRELGTSNADELQKLHKKLHSQMPSTAYWEELLQAWHAAKYPVVIYDSKLLQGDYGTSDSAWLIEQLERAVLARSKLGRAAAWPLEFKNHDERSNAAGAEYVLTARTGYPAAVQCFSGCAEFLPGVTSAEALLADGVIDAALFLGEGPSARWNAAAQQHLQKIPTAIIASKKAAPGQTCKHHIDSSDLSEEQGTVVREDGIPIPLVAKVAPENSAEKFLRQLLALVREPAAAETGAAQ
jgi:formylmethanofuran dehydrogenase subunit B